MSIKREIRFGYNGEIGVKVLAPVRAIRYRCMDCSESQSDRLDCEFITCSLHPYRDGKKGKMSKGTILFSKESVGLTPERTGDKLTPVKAIHYYCLNCMGGRGREAANNVVLCADPICSLFDYRLGRRPQQ